MYIRGDFQKFFLTNKWLIRLLETTKNGTDQDILTSKWLDSWRNYNLIQIVSIIQ